MPKAVRLMVVVAEKPACGLWSIPGTGPVGPSASRTTGLVTPCRVKLPVIVSLLPLFTTLVLVKVAVGKFATSKKSGLLRCVLRASSPVSTVTTPMVAVTRGLGHVGLVVQDGGGHFAEAAMHVGDAQMGDAEVDLAVRRIGGPGGGLRQGQGSRERQNASNEYQTLHRKKFLSVKFLYRGPLGRGWGRGERARRRCAGRKMPGKLRAQVFVADKMRQEIYLLQQIFSGGGFLSNRERIRSHFHRRCVFAHP